MLHFVPSNNLRDCSWYTFPSLSSDARCACWEHCAKEHTTNTEEVTVSISPAAYGVGVNTSTSD
jgi:hypothetical protein